LAPGLCPKHAQRKALPFFPAVGPAFSSNIHRCDDPTVNGVIHGSVWHNNPVKPLAIRGDNLFMHWDPLFKHRLTIQVQPVINEFGADIGERSPDIRGQKTEKLGGGRSKAPDVLIVIKEKSGNVRAG
jgi:hypothetical protein